MTPGVGASCDRERRRHPQNHGQRILQHPLNRAEPILAGPAVKVCAVVGYVKSKPGHR